MKTRVLYYKYEGMLIDLGFIDRVVEQPFKIPFVAAIALYANHRNADAGKTILKEFTERCQNHLDCGEWKKFKLVLRFLACSSSMISNPGLETILNSLISFAEKLASEGNNKVRVRR